MSDEERLQMMKFIAENPKESRSMALANVSGQATAFTLGYVVVLVVLSVLCSWIF